MLITFHFYRAVWKCKKAGTLTYQLLAKGNSEEQQMNRMKWTWFFLKSCIVFMLYIANAISADEFGGPYRCSDGANHAHVQVTQSDISLEDLPPVGGVITTITTSPIEITCDLHYSNVGGQFRYFFVTSYYPTVAPGGDPTVCVIPEFPGVGMRLYRSSGTALPCGAEPWATGTSTTILAFAHLAGQHRNYTVDYGDQVLAELVRIGDINPGTYTLNRVQNLAQWGTFNTGRSMWAFGATSGYIHRIDSGNTITVSEATCSLMPFNETFDLGLLEKANNAAIQPFKIHLDGCSAREDVEEFKTKATLSFIPNNAEVTMDGRIGNCDREECAENVFIRLKDWQGNPIIAGEGVGRDYELSNQGFANPMIPFEFQFDAFIDTETATAGIIDVSITILLKVK